MWELTLRWKLKWQQDEGIWYLNFIFILSTILPKNFLVVLMLNRVVHVSKGNAVCFILMRDLDCCGLLSGDLSTWCYISKAEHLLWSEMGCAKEENMVNWELATSSALKPVVTSHMTFNSSSLRASESSPMRTWRNVCVFHVYILSTQHVPGWNRCSANVCPTNEGEGR